MVAPSTSSLLTDWTWEPSVLIGLTVLLGAYGYKARIARRRHALGPPLTRSQSTAFVLSVGVLVLALLSPIDDISDTYLFSIHMVQHLLLASLWPPLMLAAIPGWMIAPVMRRPSAAALVSVCTAPVVAILIFNLDIYGWHLPPLYNLTLQNEEVHILEHLSFMLSGLIVWWPILSPLPEQRLSYPGQVLYLFASGMFMMVLGILFTFSPVVFYTAYNSAPHLWGMSRQTDQQIGGLIMWYPGNVPYAVVLVTAFYRWFDMGGPPAEFQGDESITYNENAPLSAP
jgi:putative membrane protein